MIGTLLGMVLKSEVRALLLPSLCALAFNLFCLTDANAIDTGCPPQIDNCSPTALWLSGDIVRGDLKKISNVLFQGKGSISTIVLFNMRGGDMNEAVKIGRLIHRLRIRTSVGYPIFGEGGGLIGEFSDRIYYPLATDDKNPLPVPSIPQDLSLCASACVVLWAGGYQRFGAAFLVGHRISIRPGKGATADRLAASYDDAEQRLAEYLAEMNVSETFASHLSSLEGQGLDPLFPGDLDKYFGTSNALDDIKMQWDCGNAYPSWSEIANLRPPPEEVARLAMCQASHTAADRSAAWSIVFR